MMVDGILGHTNAVSRIVLSFEFLLATFFLPSL